MLTRFRQPGGEWEDEEERKEGKTGGKRTERARDGKRVCGGAYTRARDGERSAERHKLSGQRVCI